MEENLHNSGFLFTFPIPHSPFSFYGGGRCPPLIVDTLKFAMILKIDKSHRFPEA
jgi:hypothetical protein